MSMISVIIPAYNVERFIKKAIESVIGQIEVGEIIIINDGSTDRTRIICEQLLLTDPRLRLLDHSNGVNKGRSASRNLGIKNANYEFIAFLDADDYYLKDRFKNDVNLLSTYLSCDGVYNCIGVEFYREKSDLEMRTLNLTTMNKVFDPNDLFLELLRGFSGSIHLNGLTIKKKAVEEVGCFNENLVVMEDTELIWKLALKSVLKAGKLKEPIAIRGVHDSNVFNNTTIYQSQELYFYESLFFWSVFEISELKISERFLERIWIVKLNQCLGVKLEIIFWLKLIIKTPIKKSIMHYKYSPFNRVLKKINPFKN